MKEPLRRDDAGRLFLSPLDPGYRDALGEAFQWLRLGSRLHRSDHVFIKPNLTFPVFRPGVMTSLECVDALVAALKDYTDRITIGEADSGGYNPFDIDEVQRGIGLKDLEKKYGVEVVNLSRMPRREVELVEGRRRIRFPLPTLLLDETDLLVSAAVPKIHMNSGVSMAVKNLWGCIPEPRVRLRLHPSLGGVLFEIVRRLKRTIAVIDGRYGLNRSGPMRGDPVDLNWLMAADDLYAADEQCCRLMQIDPASIPYLHYAPTREPEINRNWRPFVREPFYLVRKWTDYPGLFAFRSRVLTYFAYFSPLAGVLHKLLYLFREPFYDYDDPRRTRS